MLNEITIKNVSDADLDKWKEIQPSLEHRRRATWSFPIGNSLVTCLLYTSDAADE
mgnify:CR=1 FL=1